MQFCDLQTQYQSYKPEIDKRIQNVLDHGKYIMGPEIGELEEKLANYVGVSHTLTVASGTDSLEIALRALGVGYKDEVITVPFTWISTAEVISQVGAKPVFIDIDAKTFNMDVNLLEAAINEKTKAIIPVSLFGQMPDLETINSIAEKFKIPVIEDGAQSFGASRNGKMSNSMTTLGSTSFFPAKPFGCYGDGGALFTNDDELADKCRAIRSHGGMKRHHHTLVGMNGRFDTIQAAILLAKFDHFEAEIEKRKSMGTRYNENLKDICKTPYCEIGNVHIYGQYTLMTSNRDDLQAFLKSHSIPTAIYYPKCLHEQPVFQDLGYKYGDFPISEGASRQVLSLPFSPFLNEKDQDQVCEKVREYFEK